MFKIGCDYMYFDPGTGSLIIQLLVAGVASLGAFFALFKNKIKNIFLHEEKKDDSHEK